MKKLVLMFAVIFMSSCMGSSELTPELVYSRDELKTNTKMILVIPTMNWSGKVSEVANELSIVVTNQWMSHYGDSKVIPLPAQFAKQHEKAFADLIKKADRVSGVEQQVNNAGILQEALKTLLTTITKQFGNVNLAFTMCDATPAQYEAGKKVRLHVGYFDTENMTWKVITKLSTQKEEKSAWEKQISVPSGGKQIETAKFVNLVNDMVDASFSIIKEKIPTGNKAQ